MSEPLEYARPGARPRINWRRLLVALLVTAAVIGLFYLGVRVARRVFFLRVQGAYMNHSPPGGVVWKDGTHVPPRRLPVFPVPAGCNGVRFISNSAFIYCGSLDGPAGPRLLFVQVYEPYERYPIAHGIAPTLGITVFIYAPGDFFTDMQRTNFVVDENFFVTLPAEPPGSATPPSSIAVTYGGFTGTATNEFQFTIDFFGRTHVVTCGLDASGDHPRFASRTLTVAAGFP